MSCISDKVTLYFLDGQGKILKKSKRLTTLIIQTFVGLLEKPLIPYMDNYVIREKCTRQRTVHQSSTMINTSGAGGSYA